MLKFKNNVALKNINLPNTLNKIKNKEAKPQKLYQPIADVTGEFHKTSIYVPKIGQAPEVVFASFKLNQKNRTPKEIIESNNQFFAIRLKKRTDANMDDFTKRKEDIKKRLSLPRERMLLQQYVEYLRKNAKIKYNNALLGDDTINI